MKLKILTLTTLYPNQEQPVHAVFVKNRIVALSKLCDVKVVAPVPFSFLLKLFSGKYKIFSKIPSHEISDSIDIFHPRYLVTPKIGRNLYGLIYFFSMIGCISKLIKSYNFDILDVHWAYPDGFAGVLLAKVFNKPITITIRGSDINEYTKFFLRRKMIVYALKRANKVIAVCKDMADKISHLGVDKSKISVIPNGTSVDKFYPLDKNKARIKLGLPLDKKIILSVGRLENPKRVDYIIESVKILTSDRKHSDILLIIIGEGKLRESLMEKVALLGINDYVKFVGSKPNDELVYWYNSTDIFCLASSSEGWPNVIFESLACGTPVVASAVGGVPEVLCSEEYGFLVHNQNPEKISNAIEMSLDKKWLKDKLIEYAHANTWDKVAHNVYSVFQSIK